MKPYLYQLEGHGYITEEEWKGQEQFIKDHPLPPGVVWQRRPKYNGQVRLHRSDARPNEDEYGLENVDETELDKFQLIPY